MATENPNSGDIRRRDFATDLLACAKFHAQKPAIIDASSGETTTFEEAVAAIARLAGGLDHARVSPGATVLSLLPNASWHFLFFAAVTASGRGFAALSPETSPRELEATVTALSPSIAFAPPYLPAALRTALKDAGVDIIAIDPSAPLSFAPEADASGALRSERPGGVLFVRTSGTTGEPKFLEHTIDSLWTAGAAFAEHHHDITAGGRFLNIYSYDYLAAVFNCGVIPWSVGAAIVFDSDFQRRSSSMRLWHAVKAHDVSVLWLTPRMLKDLAEDLDTPLAPFAKEAAAKLSAVFVGMASITNEQKARFERGFGVPVLENYALTETTFLTSETMASRNRGAEMSSGAVLPWVEMTLLDIEDDDRGLGGNVQELAVKTPFIAAAIRGPNGEPQPLETNADGFYRTADAGLLSSTGDVRLAGRLRDIIKRDDGLVQLREVETVAQDHPSVETAAAVAVPHELRGESFVLFVKGDGLEDDCLGEFERWLHDALPRRMWPETVRAVDRMPLTRSGKIAKAELLDHLRKMSSNNDGGGE